MSGQPQERWEDRAALASVALLARLRLVDNPPTFEARDAAWRAAAARFLCACFNQADKEWLKALARDYRQARDERDWQ